ncbi:ABC transporter permease [Streptomyces stelliscabiei]|uniref:ABC transporter permease n=1 Tax=Streptomyces stelliscabiei TaxID=146820 RepID=UPI0029B3A18C|nr:ABC transporter permease [Streptomyces stelliscabiei]MDX2551844.1 ABC transporter permease [Streptomyces stelliscabiei]MDX2614518.1 ABC transporter permease [Streptomyces stelliscabiei]MDX2636228.1 ABC transporter permease [Streptomyces stelliscabiei]MDX2665353.1 ABC transporter permease [Streptomyces stelliscabiei]MDX2713729.1 ABC transporter permease [Streptomyces stelliscabiei]
MASTETESGTVPGKNVRDAKGVKDVKDVKDADDLAGLEAGLDALDSVQTGRPPLRQVLVQKVLPPITAVALVLAVWQLLVLAEVAPAYKLPAPSAVWGEVRQAWLQGTLLEAIWTSVSRGLLGFLAALAIGTPLGLLVARVRVVRAAIGPILSGLQSLPSVAWVPAAVVWLGLEPSVMYTVILLGAVPSIANGLVSGIDQVPPLFLRAGRTLGATGLKGTWHIVMPAALPGYVAGLKQGWAFSWRSLMAAEIIAKAPDIGSGLGQMLEAGRTNSSMPQVFLAIFLILIVGIAIDLLIFSPLERWVLRSRGLLVKS